MKKKITSSILTLALSFSSLTLMAGEADHFTNREHALKDSRTQVNSMARPR